MDDSPIQHLRRVSANVWIAFALPFVAVALFVVARAFLTRASFVPVETPISLSQGHFTTGDFTVKWPGGYSIDFDLDERQGSIAPECSSSPQTHFKLFQGNMLVEEGHNAGSYVGYLELARGTYRLDFEIVSESSCLNARHPVLRLARYPPWRGVLYATACWLSLLLVALSVVLLIHVILRSRHRPAPPGALSAPRVHPKLPLAHSFVFLPHFGLIGALTVFVLLVPVWVMTSLRITPHGLKVYLLSPGVPYRPADPARDLLIVHVDRDGNLSLNGQSVSSAELEKLLAEALASRGNKDVFVEADVTADYMVVIRTIEIVRRTHVARVVLLTPGTKKQLSGHP